MASLAGKSVIVTGAAGGIGRGACRYLAEAGASVVLADLPRADPARYANDLVRDGFRAIAVEVDISIEDQVGSMVDAALSAFGRIDGLFANAAATDQVPEEFRELMLETVLTPELGTPRSIASFVAYLFSDDAAYVQGQAIHVDGGMHVHVPQLGTTRYRM